MGSFKNLCKPPLMIFGTVSQFHVYLPWVNACLAYLLHYCTNFENLSRTFVSSSTGNIIMLHVAVPLRPHRLSRNVILPSAGGAEGEAGWEMLFFCVQNK